MPGTLYDGNNVVVGHAHLFYKPWVLTPPITIPPDSTALWAIATWETAGWKTAGATNEGFKVTVEASTTTVNIEETSTPVQETLEAKSLSIEAALAEDTMETIQNAWGGGTITTAAGPPATQKMNLTSDIKYIAAVLEMKNFKGLPRRIFIPKMSMFGSGETSFRRSSDKRLYPMKYNSLCPPEQIQIIDITA